MYSIYVLSSSLLCNKSFILIVILLKWLLFLCEFHLKCFFVLIHSLSDLFCGDVIEWIVDIYAFQNAHFLCYLHRFYLLMLGKNSVLCGISNVDNFLDVQRSNEVLCYDVWGTDDYIVNVFAGECHENSFLDRKDREVLTFVIFSHIIVPDTNVKEIAEGFSQF